MKKWIIILPVLLYTSWLLAAGVSDIQQAEEMYRQGKYQEAAGVYSNILSGGLEAAPLYYNLGNCYYKMGENTMAILNYERALLLNPSDELVRYNLKLAQQNTVDKINVLPELFLVRWYRAVETYFSADQWGYISVVTFVGFLLMMALFFYSSVVGIKKTGFIIGFFMLLFTGMSIFFATRQNYRVKHREYAIIVAPSVTVKGAPDNSGTGLFLIHEGLKVKVIGSLEEWYNIQLVDGNEGWVAKSDLEKI